METNEKPSEQLMEKIEYLIAEKKDHEDIELFELLRKSAAQYER